MLFIVRRALKALCVMSILSSSPLYALRLGDFSLRSELNQPVNIELGVQQLSWLDSRTLRISVASQADYRLRGLSYNKAFNNLRVNIQRESKSAIRLQVRGTQPLTVSNSTLLLKIATHDTVYLSKFPITFGAPLVPLQSVVVINSPSLATDEIFKARRNQSLSHVAEKLALKHKVRRYQVMLALYHANPDKFVRNNMNGMIPGSALKVPPISTFKAISIDEARSEIQQQWRDWQAGVNYAKPRLPVETPEAKFVAIESPIPVAEFSETSDAFEREINRDIAADEGASIASITTLESTDADVQIVDLVEATPEPILAAELATPPVMVKPEPLAIAPVAVEVESQPYLELRAPVVVAPVVRPVVSTQPKPEPIVAKTESISVPKPNAEPTPTPAPARAVVVTTAKGQVELEPIEAAKPNSSPLTVPSKDISRIKTVLESNTQTAAASTMQGYSSGKQAILVPNNQLVLAALVFLVGLLSALVAALFQRNRALSKQPAILSVEPPLLEQYNFDELLEPPAAANPDQLLMFPEVPQGLLTPVANEEAEIDTSSPMALSAKRDLDDLMDESLIATLATNDAEERLDDLAGITPAADVDLHQLPSLAAIRDDAQGLLDAPAPTEPDNRVPPVLMPAANDSPRRARTADSNGAILSLARPLADRIEEEGETPELNEEQQANVKINLAQIYIDLGDTTEAISMLSDVLRIGNVTQIQEAEKMLLFLSR